MKKIILIALAAAMIFATTACGGAGTSNQETTTPETNVEVTTEKSTTEELTTVEPTTEAVPMEYRNALKSAERYSKLMHMSKKRIFNQLTSEYGNKFTKDAAQYAVDNIKVDWKANALETAKKYYEDMNMSKNAIYDQLISEYGEQFNESEAQYAVDHLD